MDMEKMQKRMRQARLLNQNEENQACLRLLPPDLADNDRLHCLTLAELAFENLPDGPNWGELDDLLYQLRQISPAQQQAYLFGEDEAGGAMVFAKDLEGLTTQEAGCLLLEAFWDEVRSM